MRRYTVVGNCRVDKLKKKRKIKRKKEEKK